jgi:ABC-2 type transport system permease protein
MENFDILQAARDEDVARQLEPVVNRYNAQLARQQAATSLLRFLSPAAVAQNVLYEAAGTSMARYQHFYAQVDAFHRQWTRFFQARSFSKTRMAPEDFDRLPAFVYTEEPLPPVLTRTWAPLAALWTLAFAIAVAAFVAFRRYQIA